MEGIIWTDLVINVEVLQKSKERLKKCSTKNEKRKLTLLV